jgi:hypothetical protein
MSIDWMGRWYEIIKERGENDRPSFGCINLSTNEVDWMSFSHSEMDGVGAMIDYYEKKKIKLTKFPDLKEKKAPTLLERLYIFYRLIFKTKKLKTKWKESNDILNAPDPLKISFHVFTVEETLRILNKCRSEKVSSTSFVLNSVSHSLLTRLATNGEGTWTVPVNLRPVLQSSNIKANHSSGLLIDYKLFHQPQDTHQELALKLKQKQHWGIWWIHQIGKYLGFQAMRYISNQNAKKSFLMGSFSNLGSWDLPPNHLWVGSPPGSKNFPISVMLMVANQRMSLSLKIHPSILKNQDLTPSLLKDLVLEILQRVD